MHQRGSHPVILELAFIYLPACLIIQTGGLSTGSPRSALSISGAVFVLLNTELVSATTWEADA